MLDLLAYWAEEPPAHVILALRYLGPGKRGGKRVVTEAEAHKDLGQMGNTLGLAPQPLPGNLKEMVRWAEDLKKTKKGL